MNAAAETRIDQTSNDHPAPIGPIADAIAARIAEERKRLVNEEAVERDLATERKRLLTAGSDAETDVCEARIDASRSAQTRILERIDLLRAQLQEANATAVSQNLDAIAARANAARELGEKLIRQDYLRQAKALATTLNRMAVVEAAIQECNRSLEEAGRPSIVSPNSIRARSTARIKWVEPTRVGVNHEAHPHHADYTHRSGDGSVAYLQGGGQCEAVVEVDIEHTDIVPGRWPLPLFEVIQLPAIDPEPPVHRALPKVAEVHPIFAPILHLGDIDHQSVDALLTEMGG